ncbi:MAG: hypothetical protein K6E13_06620 [Lachnospiraceae bacterium]|nr:hypothetical protein [Lachnospiraceae bacterium]
MTVKEMADVCGFKVLNEGNNTAVVTEPYCCDLLSIAMGNAPSGCAWCTVMSNKNTLAVTTLTDAACIILCCDVAVDESLIEKAAEEDIPLFATDKPVFDAALSIYNAINA